MTSAEAGTDASPTGRPPVFRAYGGTGCPFPDTIHLIHRVPFRTDTETAANMLIDGIFRQADLRFENMRENSGKDSESGPGD